MIGRGKSSATEKALQAVLSRREKAEAAAVEATVKMGVVEAAT